MNVERVESMFEGVQEAFISEIRNLKDKLIKEFDATEKLKEINEKTNWKYDSFMKKMITSESKRVSWKTTWRLQEVWLKIKKDWSKFSIQPELVND